MFDFPATLSASEVEAQFAAIVEQWIGKGEQPVMTWLSHEPRLAADALADLETQIPGPAFLATVAAVDPYALTHPQRVELLVQLQRAEAHLAAVKAAALVAAAGETETILQVDVRDQHQGRDRRRTVLVKDRVREEIAAALHVSPRSMANQISRARALVSRYPRLHADLGAGRLSPAHAAAVARQADRLQPHGGEPEQAHHDRVREFLDAVLPVGAKRTPQRTEQHAASVVARIDAAGAEERRQAARTRSDVWCRVDVDGQSVIGARVDNATASAIWRTINQHASANADASLTIGQKRVNALAVAVLGPRDAGTADASAGEPRVDVTVSIVIGADGLLGITNDPGWVDDEPSPAAFVRELIAGSGPASTWRRLVTDPMSGRLLDAGRSRYLITDAQRDHLTTRDATCRFPGCPTEAVACQIDHAIAWNDGGPSDLANLGSLCLRHHNLKTHGGWDIVDSRLDGSCSWRTTHGRIHDHPPRELLPGVAPPDEDPPPF